MNEQLRCAQVVYDEGNVVTNCIKCGKMHVPIFQHEIYPSFWNLFKNCCGFYKIIDIISIPSNLVQSPSSIVMIYGLIDFMTCDKDMLVDFQKTILNIFENQSKLNLIVHFYECVKHKSYISNQEIMDMNQMIIDTIKDNSYIQDSDDLEQH